MQSAIFNTPVIKIDSLQNKFDTLVLSGSFVTLIGDYVEAMIFQQLHYWSYSEYGVVIDEVRWIYKPLREWKNEVFTFLTEWKLRKAIASLLEKGLIERKKLYVKHHEIKHDNPYWNPKNQTYYYSVKYDKLQELVDAVENQENAETIENVRIENYTKLSSEEIKDTKCCELSQNNTDLTSIKNSSKDQSHPTLPCESEGKKASNQNKQEFSNRSLLETKEVNSVNPEVIEKDTNVGRVEQNLNQNKSTNDRSTQPKTEQLQKPPRPSPKFQVTPTKQKRENKAPWKDELQRSQFERALIQALPIVANSYSPQGLAKTIMAQLKRGEEHTYWDDFIAGLPIGTSTKPEWEIEPGVPYPMFIEYLTEKLKPGNNTKTDEQVRNEVFRILDKPRQAKAFWGQFKRSVVNVSEQVERDRSLGVSNPNTPVWTRERIEPSVEEAAVAGQKIMAVNGGDRTAIEGTKTPQLESTHSGVYPFRDRALDNQRASDKPQPPEPDPWTEKSSSEPEPSSEEDKPESKPQPSLREMLAARSVKGFCRTMPKVSREEAEAEAKAELEAKQRQQMNRKTHLSQMSVDEINELVKDPILRAQLTPQLMQSNYELITDELGQVIGVELSELQKREKRSQRLEE